MYQKRFHQSGITLLELMIATAIVSILATISITSYNGYILSSNTSRAVSEIRTLSFLIDDYARNNGVYPQSLADVSNDNLTDPWGNPYAYLYLRDVNGNGNGNGNGKGNVFNIGASRKDGSSNPINTQYDLYSKGPDGNSVGPLTAKPSRDDIVYANDGGFIGVASDF